MGIRVSGWHDDGSIYGDAPAPVISSGKIRLQGGAGGGSVGGGGRAGAVGVVEVVRARVGSVRVASVGGAGSAGLVGGAVGGGGVGGLDGGSTTSAGSDWHGSVRTKLARVMCRALMCASRSHLVSVWCSVVLCTGFKKEWDKRDILRIEERRGQFLKDM